MNGMALIIAAALTMGLGGLIALLWAINAGQYEDLEGDAVRILVDDAASLAAPDRPTDA